MIGGHDLNGTVSGTVEEYDPGLDTWTIRAPMRVARSSAAAATVVSEARELNSLLMAVATEVEIVNDPLLRELDRQTQAVREASHAAPHLPQSLNGPPEPPRTSDRLLHLPAWLPRNKEATKKETAEDRHSTAA